VVDVTGGDPCIVEGPVSRETALQRERELSAAHAANNSRKDVP
jgi:hypothetical protein